MHLAFGEFERQDGSALLRACTDATAHRVKSLIAITSVVAIFVLAAGSLPEILLRSVHPILVDAFLLCSERLLMPFRGSLNYFELLSSLTVVLVTLSYAVPAIFIFLVGRKISPNALRIAIWSWLVIFIFALALPIPI